MFDQKALRLSAALLFFGIVVSTVAEMLHPGGGDTYQATLADFAASGSWTAIHLGQFAGMALLIAGLLVLFFALNLTEGAARWFGLFGAISAGVALALDGVLFAVDGVANRQAALAYVNAPEAEKVARFAAAQAVRWVEEGTSSYHNLTLGLAIVLLALAIVGTARVPRPIGYLMVVSGIAYVALGWLVGTTGFTPATTAPTYLGYGFLALATIWLLIIVWRRKELAEPVTGRPATAR